MPRWTRVALGTALFVTLVPLLGLVQIDLKARYLGGRRLLPPQGYTLPPAGVLKGLAFGYNELAADLLWVGTISYYVDHLRWDRDFRYMERHLQNIIALDRHVKHVYRYGAVMLTVQGEGRTNREVLAAIRLLEQGHEIYPDDWHIPLTIGVYYLSELRSKSKKQRAAWKLRGAEWIRRATLVGASVPWLPSLAAKLYTQQGKRELAILYLQEAYQAAPTDRIRTQIAGKLKALHAAKVAAELKQTTQALREARLASPVSFVSPNLFLLVGLPKLEPFSLKRLVEPHSPVLLR